MKRNIFILHGAYGNPEEGWFLWLKTELEKMGFEVIVPRFPTPEGQTLDSWNQVFKQYEDKINEESIFVGHSLAPAFILNLLERVEVKVSACFFVAPFVQLLGNPDFDGINKTFLKEDFDWEKIKNHCNKFVVYYSDNDPYVAEKFSVFVAEKTGAEKILVKNGGHFNAEAGYTQFPELLEKISSL